MSEHFLDDEITQSFKDLSYQYSVPKITVVNVYVEALSRQYDRFVWHNKQQPAFYEEPKLKFAALAVTQRYMRKTYKRVKS